MVLEGEPEANLEALEANLEVDLQNAMMEPDQPALTDHQQHAMMDLHPSSMMTSISYFLEFGLNSSFEVHPSVC